MAGRVLASGMEKRREKEEGTGARGAPVPGRTSVRMITRIRLETRVKAASHPNEFLLTSERITAGEGANRFLLGLADGNGKVEARAAPQFTFHPNTPVMGFHEMPGYGEAESGAAGLAGARGIHAIEALENPGLIAFWNADTGVGHGEDDFTICEGGADGDQAAGRCVLQGVVEQVLENIAGTSTVMRISFS